MKIRGYRVFYLDLEEDINSLLTTLGQESSEKLALVVDQRSMIFNSRINMQLLQKYLEDWGKEWVFVSQEMRLIRLVLETDLKIYPDLEGLKRDEPIIDVDSPIITSLSKEELLGETVQSTDAEPSVPMYRSKRYQARWKRRLILAVIALLILGGLTWFYIGFPIVTVEVSPTINKLEKNLAITCEYGLDQVLISEQKIPLLTFRSDVAGQVNVKSSGRKKIGFTRAEGVVVLINNQAKEVILPAGTKLKTSTGITFKTVEKVTIPKVQGEYMLDVLVGTKAGKGEVKIVALEAGSLSNVASGRITQFDGQNYGLQVINPEATRGGSDREEMIVTQKDLDQTIRELEIELKKLIKAQLIKEIGSDYLVLEDTLYYEMENVETDHHVDEQAEEITASGQIVASGYLLLKDDLRVITEELYLSDLAANYTLYSSGIQISKIELIKQEQDSIQLNLTAQAQVVAQIKTTAIADQLKGQTMEYADGILRQMKEIRYFRILADGKSRIPKFTFAIRVLVRDPTEAEGRSI